MSCSPDLIVDVVIKPMPRPEKAWGLMLSEILMPVERAKVVNFACLSDVLLLVGAVLRPLSGVIIGFADDWILVADAISVFPGGFGFCFLRNLAIVPAGL